MPELIEHGVSGLLSESEAEAIAAVRRLGNLDRTGVRAHAERFSLACMVSIEPGQSQLWASTGVKDKAFDDTRYVVDLVAPDTVNTMPEATLQAVADHSVVRGNTIQGSYDAAQIVLDDLARIGLDMTDVAATLEAQGIASFAKSWDELIASVIKQLEMAGAEVMPAGAVTPASGDGEHAPAPAAAAPRQTSARARS